MLGRLHPRGIRLLPILLAGCVSAGSQGDPAVSQALDGDYSYTRVLTRVLASGHGFCSQQTGTFTAEVRGGRFSAIYNRRFNDLLYGSVDAGGKVTARGTQMSGTIRFEGRIENGRLTGIATSPNCVYEFRAV